MMFLRSMFAFQFLPPRQLLNLLSEAIPKASHKDSNSPPPSLCGAASLETFVGAALRGGNQSTLLCLENHPATHFRVDIGPQPGSSSILEMSALSPKHPPLEGFGWSLQGLLSVGSWVLWPPCFSEDEVLSMWVSARLSQLAGGSEEGRQPAAVSGSLGKRWLGAKELHCNSCLPTTFSLQRALNDGAEIVQ